MSAPTTAAPVYDCRHEAHSLADVTGYDVVKTTGPLAELVVEVIATFDGAGRYGEALAAAKTVRGGDVYGYVCHRWDGCGCRWVATVLADSAGRPVRELAADAGA